MCAELAAQGLPLTAVQLLVECKEVLGSRVVADRETAVTVMKVLPQTMSEKLENPSKIRLTWHAGRRAPSAKRQMASFGPVSEPLSYQPNLPNQGHCNRVLCRGTECT